ncbi:MAG: hypothetical protein JXL67_07170, partial [Calditrichaeota bacterium]|nr:hypothetical protein [Calditrichota bacterium]
PLIDYRKGTITLEGYLSELKKIPLSNRPQFRTVKEFSDELGVWIRDKLLLEEAYRKNMNHRDAVKKEVKEFKEKQSYYYFYNREFSNVEIPPGIQDYFEKGKKTNRLAARYHTLQEWIAWQAEQNLHQRLLRYPADIVVDSSLVRQEARQIDWSNRIRMIVVPKLQ